MAKQLIFFKRYLVPHPIKDTAIFKLVSRFYAFLALDKVCVAH